VVRGNVDGKKKKDGEAKKKGDEEKRWLYHIAVSGVPKMKYVSLR
jgi:hypothetical protein